MKKVKSILALGLLMLVMNSCVYSLFPIYTDDTLASLPGLIGRWGMEGKPEEFIEFSGLSAEKNELTNSLDGTLKHGEKLSNRDHRGCRKRSLCRSHRPNRQRLFSGSLSYGRLQLEFYACPYFH